METSGDIPGNFALTGDSRAIGAAGVRSAWERGRHCRRIAPLLDTEGGLTRIGRAAWTALRGMTLCLVCLGLGLPASGGEASHAPDAPAPEAGTPAEGGARTGESRSRGGGGEAENPKGPAAAGTGPEASGPESSGPGDPGAGRAGSDVPAHKRSGAGTAAPEGTTGGGAKEAGELSAAGTEEVIGEIRAAQGRLKTLTARIETREYDALAEETIVRKGTLAVKFPDRVRRDFSEPKKYSWILNGRILYEYLPDLKEAYRTDFGKGNKAASVLAAALSMDLNGLKEHFSMKAFRTSDGAIEIRMAPVRPEWAKTIAMARVEIPAGGVFMRRMEIEMRSGDRVTDIYSDIVPDGKVEDNAFDFVAPAGVKVIERKVE
ncbi:MAG: outer-membrane lipoprotein carrier protein LolA [Planctomycetota bacterium]|nr:outer-membrane lipoprotein carrier protein LolA [Planctomycetota bacterium]